MACCYSSWKGAPCAWWDAAKILPDIVSMRVENRLGPVKNTLRDASLICLDDVGIKELTPAQLEALLIILNERLNKPLMMTGNLPPERLSEVMDDRAASRICAGCVIEVTGEDRRLSAASIFKA